MPYMWIIMKNFLWGFIWMFIWKFIIFILILIRMSIGMFIWMFLKPKGLSIFSAKKSLNVHLINTINDHINVHLIVWRNLHILNVHISVLLMLMFPSPNFCLNTNLTWLGSVSLEIWWCVLSNLTSEKT